MFTSRNPATGEAFAQYEVLGAAGIEAKLTAAAAAYRHWRLSDHGTRTALLARIADVFASNRDELALMATREMGKTLKSARAEVDKCVAGFRLYAERGPDFLAPTQVGSNTAHWLPMGPVLAIMPWNFPYWQVVRFLAPTIMAGNVGLLKHASLTQGCAALIERMVVEAGAPEGVFQNLPIRSDAVAPLIDDARVAAVTLTGSEGAGMKVAEAAGRALKKVVLELGGSDPFIVMPSADIAAAAKTAVTARTQNAGQSCICAKRMIVHSDVYDEFLDRFVGGMAALKIGDPEEEATDMGPLSSIEQRDAVLDQIAEAQAEGATLRTGGQRIDRAGAWMTAGVLTDVDPGGRFAKQEVFGPVAMVLRADDLESAITLANDVPFGLGAAVFTQDPAEQARFVRDIEAGMIAVNTMLASTPDSPFGGIKRSGHGRELGPWGLHEFMNLKTEMREPGPKVGD